MSLKFYQCVVKIKSGTLGNSTVQCKVQVAAENIHKAKLQIEQQYGRGNIVSSLTELR